jgi:hypothetical protein
LFLLFVDKIKTIVMKRLYPLLLILATPLVLFLIASSTGSPGGKSGSPGDGNATCTQCHTGAATAVPGWITTDIPAEGYTSGETYTITVSGTHPGVVKFGFELTVENSEGDKAGTLQISEPARTKLVNASKAVTHTAAGNVPSGNNNTWTVNWVAPSGVEGPVGIYAAFNAANGNGNTSGDVIYTSQLFVSEAALIPILLGIQPDSALQGELVSTSISGENTSFSGTPTVRLSFSGNGLEVINATNVVVQNGSTLLADFQIPASASTGLWDLHVNSLGLENAFTVNLFTSIADLTALSTAVFPNPANHYFYIENAEGQDIQVYNADGKRMLSMANVSEKQYIDISGFARGLYFVRVLSTNQDAKVHKLIVN